MQQSVYRDLSPRVRSISILRRNVQAAYLEKLVELATNPQKGTPADAGRSRDWN